MKKLFSVVLPIYNNEKNLPETIPYIIDEAQKFDAYDIEIVMVNDGSKDNSYEVMKQLQQTYPDKITIANLERNFGQGACTECGLALAKGDVVGVISADLQDPFELFGEMLESHAEGYKFVCAIREGRKDQKLYAIIAKLVHKFMNKFIIEDWPKGGCDFYLADRSVVDKFISIYKVRQASSLATFLYLTNNRKEITYTRQKREKGKSGYSIKRKFQCLKEWVFYNSDFPIRCFALCSIMWCMIMCFLWGLLALVDVNTQVIKNIFEIGVVGIICAGIWSLGQYIWILIEMGKKLPRYIIAEVKERRRE